MKHTPIHVLTLLLLCAFSLQAQSLVDRIPDTALGVMRIDSKRYSDKVDMDKVMELDLFKMMDDQAQKNLQDKYDVISKIYKAPAEAGVNLMPKSYAYVEMLDSLYLMSYLFKVSDIGKLESFLGETLIPMSQEKKITKGSGYKYVTNANGGAMMVAWTKEVASFMFVEGENSRMYEGLDYDDPNYYQKIDERRAAFNQVKMQALMEKAGRVNGLKKGNVSSNANFQKFEETPFDVAVWLSANAFSKVIAQVAGKEVRDPMQLQLMEQVQSLNKDYYYHLGLNFEAGALDLKMRTFLPPAQFSKYSGLYSKRPNPKFFQYIMGNSLLGMGSIAIDIKGTVEALLDTYRPMLGQSPEFGPMVEPSLDLMGIALDEDALANIFKGDLLFAVTDIREIETTYIDYVYDENFNMEKVEKTRKQNQPIITAMATIGDNENFNKLINALQAFGTIKKDGNIYKVTLPNAKISPTLAVVDGMLLATNDDQLIPLLESGQTLKGKQQLNKLQQAEILKHSQYFLLNLDGIMNKVMEEDNVPNKAGMELIANRLDDAKLTGLDVKDSFFQYDFRIDMKDQKTNAAMQLFQLANEFFMMQQGGGEKY